MASAATYQKNIPQPNDLLSQSQSDIQQNYLNLSDNFKVNHIELEDGTDAGKHADVIIKKRGIPVPVADEASLFVNTSTYYAADFPESLYLGLPNLGSAAVPLNIYGTLAGSHYYFLTNGLVVKFGWSPIGTGGVADSTAGTKNIVFTVSADIPQFTAKPLWAMITLAQQPSASVNADIDARVTLASRTPWTNLQVPYYYTGGGTNPNVYYIAIGPV